MSGRWRRAIAVASAMGLLASVVGCKELSHIQVFKVSIANDTSRAVVVRGCRNFCSSSLLTFELAPGESTPINRTTNQHKYFSVATAAGAHLGCLDLYFAAPQPGAIVRVSQAGPCPANPRRPWKAIGLVVVVLTVGLLLVSTHMRRSREN